MCKNSIRKRYGLYVHVPFCRMRCKYCGFYAGRFSQKQRTEYIDAVLCEARLRKRYLNEKRIIPEIHTLYIGGGTPSQLESGDIARLINGVCEVFRIDKSEFTEATIEANPEDIDLTTARIWRESGINRVSIGVQSLIDSELKLMGRNHSASKAIEALGILTSVFDNVSADIITGVPGQTLDSIEKTLVGVIESGVQHISSYTLAFEDKTVFSLMKERGDFCIDEDVASEQFYFVKHLLENSGYRQYEISNFAIEGYESVHNRSYWEGYPYIGLGAAAHSYDGERCRSWNRSDLSAYMRIFGNETEREISDIEIAENEILSDDERKTEVIMLQLRMAKGINMSEFKKYFGEDAAKELLKRAEQESHSDLLEIQNGFIKLTEKGLILADAITGRLIN